MKSQTRSHNIHDENIKVKKYKTILGLLPDKKYTLDELKKKYRIAALKYHPDKNFNSESSTKKFKEINEAYLFLYGKCGKCNSSDTDSDDSWNDGCNNSNGGGVKECGGDEREYCYSQLFSKFINSLMKKFSNAQVAALHIIIQILMNKCATLTSAMFNHMDRESLLFIHHLIVKYNTILEISSTRLTSIHEIIKKKLQENDIIIIQPTISELFDKNNINLKSCDEKSSEKRDEKREKRYGEEKQSRESRESRELIVKCIPVLPEHIYIDELNNIYIDVRTRVETLFNQPKLTVSITESISFDIPVHTLEFKTHQTVTLKQCGIPMINTENIYDVSEKMDVIIHLEIVI
jgi:DnaJ-class molecular chaperone